MKLKIQWGAVCALIVALAVLAGCQYKEGDEASPTAPMSPTCTADAPDALQVTASTVGCTDESCIASYAVSNLGLQRIAWSFPEGEPAESSNASLQVRYPRALSFPRSFAWALTACTCSRSLDPEGDSCRSVSGTVTFDSLNG